MLLLLSFCLLFLTFEIGFFLGLDTQHLLLNRVVLSLPMELLQDHYQVIGVQIHLCRISLLVLEVNLAQILYTIIRKWGQGSTLLNCKCLEFSHLLGVLFF